MRVLFLAPKYMDLYVNVLDELNRLGVEVVFIEDKPHKYNFRFGYTHSLKARLRNLVYYFYNLFSVNWKKYWDEKLQPLDDLYFDKLFVINGFSYHNCLLRKLKAINKSIDTRLYLWDNLYAYNFSYIIKDFNECYTLDYKDALDCKKLSFLPAFWVKKKDERNNKIEYDVFMIGTNHDDRYYIASSIIKQLKNNNLSYCIKLVDNQLPEDEIIIHSFFPTEQYLNLMDQSRCILDTERPSQTGPTVRLVWALALGKRIISTNAYMRDMPFYNPNQICIIDRKTPTVDANFISNNKPVEFSEYIESLRIDNWIRTVLF